MCAWRCFGVYQVACVFESGSLIYALCTRWILAAQQMTDLIELCPHVVLRHGSLVGHDPVDLRPPGRPRQCTACFT